jgi:thiol-disulfide isomerase/thioredoxin
VRSADVPDLAALYALAGDSARARAHLLLRALGARLTGRAASVSYANFETTSVEEWEREVAIGARIDSLPDAVADLKAIAHEKLLVDARASNDHDRIATHAARVLLGAWRASPSRQIDRMAIAGAAGDLVQSLEQDGLVDSARAVLSRVRGVLGASTFASAGLVYDSVRVALVGRAAAPIEAPRWINAAAGATRATFGDGRVTVVQMTGESCAPCRASYPALHALYDRYDRSQLDIVFVTALGGVFEGAAMSRDAELTATTDYYTTRFGFPFRIAVHDSFDALEHTLSSYGVHGIPEIVVIDKRGIVRRAAMGWDARSAATLDALVASLVAER